jgi:DNA-binding response OmpR family regulator
VSTPRRILLIDDTPEIAELLTFALRDHGYDVVATGYTDTVSERVVD